MNAPACDKSGHLSFSILDNSPIFEIKKMAINEKATVEVQVNGEQAKKEMRELESYANSLKGRLADAYAAGDTKKIKELEKELKQTNAQLKVMRTNAKNIDVAMNNIGLATPKELKQLLRDINSRLNSGNIKRGSAEWKKYQEQLKLVNAEIRKVNGEIKESESWLTRFNNGFAKWGALAASGIAAITGVSMTLNKMRKDRDAKESSAANLKALTGLDDSSIRWLTRQAEILSTSMHNTGLRVTQSSKDILEAYMLVGSAKPDLLTDKEALNAVTIEAMRLSKAAKMDLKEAVDAVTLSMNQYGAAANKAADYANVMAAGSKFGAAAVQSITSAVTKAGVSASTAKVPIEQLVGSIETLAEKGIKDEVAGTGLKMFFLRLQTGADETNPKIVGLQTALKNLQKLSTDEVVKRFGAETYTVAQTLIDGADKVEYYTKAVTGTNVAMEQASINSATNEARMAQLKNQIRETGIVLMEKLNPSLNMLTGWTTKIIKMAPAFIDFIKEYGSTIVWLSAVILIYAARIKLVNAYQTVCNTLTTIGTAVQLAYATAINHVDGYTKTAIVSKKALMVLMGKHNILLATLRVSTYLYAASLNLLKGRLDLAAKSMRLAWGVMAASPVGILTALFAGATYASYKLTKQTQDYYSVEKTNERISGQVNRRLEEERKTVDELTAKIHDNSLSLNKRREAVKKLKELIPDYNAVISAEGDVVDENTASLQRYNAQLAMTIELETINAELERRRTNLKRLENSPAFKDNSLMGSMAREDVRSKIAAEESIIKELTDKYEALFDERLKALNGEPGQDNASGTKCPVCGNSPCTCVKGVVDKEKAKKEALAKEESNYQKELEDLKQSYLNSDLMTQEEYARLAEDLELQHLNRQLEIAGMEPGEIEKINQKILDAKIRFKERCVQEDEKEYKEAPQRALTAREKQYQLDVEAATRYHYQNMTAEKDFLQVLSDLEYDYYNDMLNNYQLTEEQKAAFQDKIRDNQLKEDEKEYKERKKKQEKEKALAQKYTDIAKGIAEDYGETLGEMIANGELTMKDFLRETLLMAVDALEKVIDICVVEVMAKNVAATAPLSFIGVAKAAIQIAAIKTAFAAVKGIIGNFYTGGFTGPGEWDRPQGIVHSNEFVANRFAVANPAIRPVLNLIDHAQRTNTVGSLTASDMSTAIAPPMMIPVSEGGMGVDPELHRLVAECTEVMRKVKSRLQEPLVAETYVSGKRGINQAQKEYNRLNNNKSRNRQ